MSIKDLLNLLSDEERRLLNYAFENGMSAHVILKDTRDRYIGVNTSQSPLLIPEQTAGAWSSGRIKLATK